MVDILKNIGNNLTPNQLPPPQVLPSGPELVQYVENGPLNQSIAKMLTQNSAGVQEMLKAKFKFLGATEIVTGVIGMIIGIVKMCILSSRNRFYDFALVIGTPWWTGVLFVTAGSLALAVERIPTVSMIRGCITFHIISAISCLPATIIYAGAIACFAILLLLTLLNAAISIAVSSFNCKALNCCGTTSVPIIVVYNNTSEQLVPLQQLYANTHP
ncbi:membrane-spanning 4-domains subfamily A member 18-like isoform X2 [Hemiscyllium ocellatum]|uniref:membrane-spanning 4-domains subfamily A member 18-like isoform X2 n=1 Tax=Hemiscyllium ocellatum TaxID=170820 RepID=UPI002966E1A4|nr:membrane-spanning 4-domains subfamily A member 18-like isoform X2 [Hemiscyllium ocellatum]